MFYLQGKNPYCNKCAKSETKPCKPDNYFRSKKWPCNQKKEQLDHLEKSLVGFEIGYPCRIVLSGHVFTENTGYKQQPLETILEKTFVTLSILYNVTMLPDL